MRSFKEAMWLTEGVQGGWEPTVGRPTDALHDAALFGVNPWRLQAWMGHKRIDETMLYVHVAEAHGRELPECIRDVALGETDPDVRVRKMPGARGKNLAKTVGTENERAATSAA